MTSVKNIIWDKVRDQAQLQAWVQTRLNVCYLIEGEVRDRVWWRVWPCRYEIRINE